MFKYNIKKRREELRLSLQDIAHIVGVNKTTILKWEQGRIGNMGRDKIALLSKALHITPEEFMGWVTPDVPQRPDKLFYERYMLLKLSDDAKDRAAAAAIEQLLGLPLHKNDTEK